MTYETFVLDKDRVGTVHPYSEQEMEEQNKRKESQHIFVQGLIDGVWDVVEPNEYHFEVKVTKDEG